MVGGGIADAFTGTIGAAAYVAPVAFVVVGALMVARSELVDVRPFRTGLLVTAFGLLTALGVKRLPLPYTLYSAGLLLLLLLSPSSQQDTLQSAGRYLVAGFPAFLLLGRWMTGRPWLQQLWLSGGFMLQGVLASIFLSGGPIY
jgi:hypothetical protein